MDIGRTVFLAPASSFGLPDRFALFGSSLWRCFEGSLAAGSRSDRVHGVRSIALSCRRCRMDGHELRRAPAVCIVAYQVSLDTCVARMKAITLGGKKSQLVQRT